MEPLLVPVAELPDVSDEVPLVPVAPVDDPVAPEPVLDPVAFVPLVPEVPDVSDVLPVAEVPLVLVPVPVVFVELASGLLRVVSRVQPVAAKEIASEAISVRIVSLRDWVFIMMEVGRRRIADRHDFRP